MRDETKRLTIYSFAHFLIDFACTFIIFSSIAGKGGWVLYLLLYNFFAFALQMPIGLIADSRNQSAALAALGCLLTAVPLVYCPAPIAACILAGIGNAMFHIAGGLDVLRDSGHSDSVKGKIRALGIFVSPGAIGLFLGRLEIFREYEIFFTWMTAALLASLAIIFILLRKRVFHRSTGEAPFSIRIERRYIWSAVCLFLVVCLRSYTGLTISYDWKSDMRWAVVFVIAIVLGKVTGGFFSDWVGAVRAAVVTLGLSTILFLFEQIPVCGVLAVFFFNMTMPVTLGAMADIFPRAKGFSFGLLTFALFIGFIPSVLRIPSFIGVSWRNSFYCVVSLGLLTAGLRRLKLKET